MLATSEDFNGVIFRARTESGLRSFMANDVAIVKEDLPFRIEDGRKVYNITDLEFMELIIKYG